MPVAPCSTSQSDFASSSARLNASVVLMSGFGAPLFTARPATERATSVRVAATSLPCLMRSSAAGAPRMARSKAAPFSISALSIAAALKLNVSLCSVAFSNCCASSCSAVFMAFEANTLISAACVVAAMNTARANSFPAMSAGFIRMASSSIVVLSEASLSVDARDCQELVRLEARAAHQRSVDVGDAHEFRGIGGLHGAAVENADPASRLTVARGELPADEAVHLGDVRRRRREPAADRPDRLIGDDQIFGGGAVRQRAVELRPHHGERAAGLAFAAGLPDADNGREPGTAGGQRLLAHVGIGLPVVAAPLGVPDDGGGRAGVLEHFGRQVAGECAPGLGVAVLAADQNRAPLGGGGKAGQ